MIGPSGSVAFTLPAGYRPAAMLFTSLPVAGVVSGNMLIAANGEVTPFCNPGRTALVVAPPDSTRSLSSPDSRRARASARRRDGSVSRVPPRIDRGDRPRYLRGEP